MNQDNPPPDTPQETTKQFRRAIDCSIEKQREMISQYAKRRNIEIVAECVEGGKA